MPTTINSAGITFNDATSLTSAVLAANSVGATQITNGSVTAVKLGTNEQKQICKAWVNFNGGGTIGTNQTIRSSYNVSSVTKNAQGDYMVNFISDVFADANYVVTGIADNQSSPAGFYPVAIRTADGLTARTTNQVRIQCISEYTSWINLDAVVIQLQMFGN